MTGTYYREGMTHFTTSNRRGCVKTQLCHPENSEGSLKGADCEILRVAQNDTNEMRRGCVGSFDTPSSISIMTICHYSHRLPHEPRRSLLSCSSPPSLALSIRMLAANIAAAAISVTSISGVIYAFLFIV